MTRFVPIEPPDDVTRVLVVHFYPVIRAGLRAFLSAHPDLIVVGEAGDGATAVRLAAELDPEVILLESALPGLDAGMITQFRENRPERKILALADHADLTRESHLLAAGTAGYVLERAEVAELVRAIRTEVRGDVVQESSGSNVVAAGSVSPSAGAAPEDDLTERESEVVRLVALGYGDKQIGVRLNVSIKTVETYKARALRKLGVRGRVNLIKYAIRRGWFNTT